MYRIPQEQGFSQPNNGDVSGNLRASLNLDLKTNPGKLRISPRMKVLTKDNDSSISNFGVPVSFASINGFMFAVTGIGNAGEAGTGKVLKNTGIDYSAFANLASSYATDEPTTVSLAKSDAVVWQNNLFVSVYGGGGPAMNIAKLTYSGPSWNSDWYTTTASGSFQTNGTTSGNLCVGFNGNLYVLDNDWITYVGNTSGTAVRCTGSGNPNVVAGTIDFRNQYHPIWMRTTSNKMWVCLMAWENSNDSSGEALIAEWDGNGTAVNKFYKVNAPSALSGVVVEDTLFIIDAYGILKKFTGNGFTEVARLPVANMNVIMPGSRTVTSNNRWIHQRGMSVVDGKINILVNNYVSSGVYVDEMPSGVWEYDPNKPQMGLYHKNAPCADTTDYGQQYIADVGAIYPLKTSSGNFFAGVSYYTDDATTNRKAVFYDDIATNTSKRGAFVTPFLKAEQLQDFFDKTIYRHSPISSGDKIIGKYRNSKDSNFPFTASATWTSTTTFTSTDTDFANVVEGIEVEPVMGKSASTTAHVSSISLSGSTYTVTLDEAIGQASGTFKVRLNNFKKMGVLSATGDMIGDLPINDTSVRTQIKTEVRATGNFEIDDINITNRGNKTA